MCNLLPVLQNLLTIGCQKCVFLTHTDGVLHCVFKIVLSPQYQTGCIDDSECTQVCQELEVWTVELSSQSNVENKSHLPNRKIRQKFHKHKLTNTLCRRNPQRGLFGSCCILSWSITIAPKISCQLSHASLTQLLSYSCSFSSYLLSKKP